ncbi:FAD-binding oxidoreductase [Microbacterium hydrocarbonoxydans]|uniref:FAD-binding oxidoreductase n=1 Tax=Microbacterium hydrocarbonoxydans TaxID=273678 RepID=UPI0020420B78|nr:FAD-binding oxidoreductase [Microbacterium hydrocarbonoxydans]MCM3780436.1 FAD-binding oxidoreductase [Microbacterium hydrocarbonoxydans]
MNHGNGRAAAVAEMRWNGWGDPAKAKDLPLAVRTLLPLLLGRIRKPEPGVRLEEVELAPSALDKSDVAVLATIVGAEHVSTDHDMRVRHSGGRSTPDLLRLRRRRQPAPDGVVLPRTHEEVAACLRAAVDLGIAVIPFGGGTSVVGALEPERGAHRAVISLDLRRLSGVLHVDEVSGEAVIAAGTTGPDAEAQLAVHGYELGHYPQSFRYATIGGFAAARSSGQNSAGNGRFDAMVIGIRVATPTGDVELGRSPGSAAGPDLIRVFLGSEGAFGVITEVRVRVHPIPRERVLESWTFPDFASGAEGVRRVAQGGGGPTVIRLSDEAETAVSLAQVGRIGKALSKGASAVTVYEGEGIAQRRAKVSGLLRAVGGTSTGEGASEEWLSGRFDGPYLRDSLLTAGVFCETLETATTWSNIAALKTAVESALRDGFAEVGARSYVMCHVSHVYPTGASLYFTVLAGIRDDPLAVWSRVKAGTNDAIIASGGTISHHHAVGRDHAPWLEDEIGSTGVRILRAIKRELDPAGVLNPGALIPTERDD